MSRPFKLVRRRRVLMGLASSLLVSGIVISRSSRADSAPPKDAFSVEGDQSLRERATRKQMTFGTFPEGDRVLEKDGEFRSAVIRECNLMVAGFCWDCVHPNPDEFDFEEMDKIHQFTCDYGMRFQGGSLMWHYLLPQWLQDKLSDPKASSEDIKEIVNRYISTAVGRYAGKADSWIVVNEAIEPKDGREDGLRMSPWMTRLGEDYIEFAFRAAAAADPNLLLIYNDNGFEYDTPDHESRRVATLRLLEHLKSKDTPIHALGLQSHLEGDRTDVSYKSLRRFLKEVEDLGLKIFVTELDVSDNNLPAEIGVRDRLVAQVYEEFLTPVLESPAVVSVITWGLSDRYTWLTQQAPRSDDLPVRPLPLDEQMDRKLAWNAIARAIDGSPVRNT
jgi:endo-1,4-beta-xylanase